MRMCVFVFVYVQVRICEKWTKTSQKPTKTSTRLEKGKKPKPKKKFIQEKPKMTKVILRDSENNKRDSLLKYEDLYNNGPPSFSKLSTLVL
jgi:hypothetical protein